MHSAIVDSQSKRQSSK